MSRPVRDTRRSPGDRIALASTSQEKSPVRDQDVPQPDRRPTGRPPRPAPPSRASARPTTTRSSASSRPPVPADVDAAVEAAQRRLPGLERRCRRRSAARSCSASRALLAEHKEELSPAHDPRDGQGAARGARRRAGGDRRRVLHGRRGPAPVRPDRAVGDARQVRDGHPPADRRGRHHHALELPGRDPRLEALPGAHLRQHRGHQAAPATRRPASSASSSCWCEGGIPDGVVNVVTGSGGEVGNAIVDHPDVRVISFTGHTDTGVEISRRAARDAQARQPGARRQEPDRRLGGRRPRPGARLGASGPPSARAASAAPPPRG